VYILHVFFLEKNDGWRRDYVVPVQAEELCFPKLASGLYHLRSVRWEKPLADAVQTGQVRKYAVKLIGLVGSV
jgi:hypothetical protein